MADGKVKIKYECSVCGFLSEMKEETAACEAQGKPNQYQEEELIRVRNDPNGVFDGVTGKINTIVFKKKTHVPSYEILIDSAARAALKIVCLVPGEYMSIGFYREENLIPLT